MFFPMKIKNIWKISFFFVPIQMTIKKGKNMIKAYAGCKHGQVKDWCFKHNEMGITGQSFNKKDARCFVTVCLCHL